MRVFAGISLAAVLSGVTFGQAPETPPAFLIADVHESAKTLTPQTRPGILRGDRYEIRASTMVDLIRTAYGVDADKVLSGPSWLEWDRFDVSAKTPPKTSPEALKLMLQGLLADRFKLTLHKDMKELPGYALTAGKKPQLKEAENPDEPGGCKFTIDGLPQPGQAGGPVALPPTLNLLNTCHNMTMAAFAEGMRSMALAPSYLGIAQVVDKTGLKGSWDFTFKYSLPLRSLIGGPGDGSDTTITLFAALDKQLGLKLEPLKVSTTVLIVDSANQKPTPNLPGVAANFPPPPPSEFEVADIKPSPPGGTGRGGGIQAGGRLDLRGSTRKSFLTLAYDIPSDDFLVGAPKWFDQDHFDLIARAPSYGVPTAQGQAQAIDVDALRLMVRTLLADRFKLVTHYEDRPVNAYTLTAAKPKLAKADPSSRTGCREGPGPDGKDPRIGNPALSRLVWCQNMTMAQLAEYLPLLSTGLIRTTVADATGLEGAWDFGLSFSITSPLTIAIQGGGRGGGDFGPPPPPPPPGGGPAQIGPAASDPTGALSLQDALSKQLGLKLETQKRPMPVLVIDHVEEKLTDN